MYWELLFDFAVWIYIYLDYAILEIKIVTSTKSFIYIIKNISWKRYHDLFNIKMRILIKKLEKKMFKPLDMVKA